MGRNRFSEGETETGRWTKRKRGRERDSEDSVPFIGPLLKL